MIRRTMFRNVGMVGMLSIALTGVAFGQGQNQIQAQRSTDVSQAAVVGHALGMAIEGYCLQEASLISAQSNSNQQQQQQQRERGECAQELQRRGAKIQQESDRLFREASRSVGQDANQSANQQFFAAAQRYAQTLKALDSSNREDSTRQNSENNNNNNNNNNNRSENANASLQGDELAKVCLINSYVRDSLAACKLRHLARLIGTNSEGATQLQQHARQMATESQQGIQKIAERANQTENKSNVANRPSTATLAQQARDVIAALKQLDESNDRDR